MQILRNIANGPKSNN